MELIEELRTGIGRELEHGEWPHRPTCQMLKNPPKGLFDGFSCNCDAATLWMRIHEAMRKMLNGHEGCHRCDWGEHRGGDFEPCSTVLNLAEALGIEATD